MREIEFVVEQAGCTSCAALICDVLEDTATVRTVEVDEATDTALVRLCSATPLGQDVVEHALQEASTGSGHDYRVRLGSWSVRKFST